MLTVLALNSPETVLTYTPVSRDYTRFTAVTEPFRIKSGRGLDPDPESRLYPDASVAEHTSRQINKYTMRTQNRNETRTALSLRPSEKRGFKNSSRLVGENTSKHIKLIFNNVSARSGGFWCWRTRRRPRDAR